MIFIHNIYNGLIKEGFQPEEIRAMIIEEFDTFFINKEALDNNAINSLLPELVNLLKLNNPSKFYTAFIELIEMLNSAKKQNNLLSIDAIEEYNRDINIALDKYWVIYSLDRDRVDMNLEEFTKFTFDQIEDIIEIMIKPYCLYIMHNIYILKGKEHKIQKIRDKNLGTLVNEIIQSNYLKDIFTLKVLSLSGEVCVKLNTLRNIGAHNDYIVIKNKIICYVRNDKNKIKSEIELDREILQKIIFDTFNFLRAIKLAYTIFLIDNMEEICNNEMINFDIRKEHLKLNTFYGIQSQGFRIIEFLDSKEKGTLVLQEELENIDSTNRALHSSQFLYHLWEITRSNTNEIEYRNKNNKALASFKIDGQFCQKVSEGSIEFIDITSEMSIIYHNL